MKRSDYCATCGRKRRPLEPRRESWGLDCKTAIVPRREDVDGKPWQQTNDLIYHAGVWRNGGTSEDCHLCDHCLRIGLRAIKLEVDRLLDVVEAGADKDAELARLTEEIGRLQHRTKECNDLRQAGIPEYAWNHTDFLKAVAVMWKARTGLAAHRDEELSKAGAEQLVRMANDDKHPTHKGAPLPLADRESLLRKAKDVPQPR